MSTAAGPWVRTWLSQDRFDVYVAAGGGDENIALDLYEWNARLSSAFQHDLAHLEVGLRNAYDRALCRDIPPADPHWVFTPTRHFPPYWLIADNGVRYDANLNTRQILSAAVIQASSGLGPTNAPNTVASPSAGKVIAELTFGFWRYLSIKRHEIRLWRPYLHTAFQPGTARQDVDKHVRQLHRLRNRVAHHEPILSVPTALARYDDLLALAGLIGAELRTYIAEQSAVPTLLGTKPC